MLYPSYNLSPLWKMELINLFVSLISCSPFSTQIYEPIYSYDMDRMSPVFFLFLIFLFKELNFNQVQLWLRKWFSKSEHTLNTSLMSTGLAQRGWEHLKHQRWCEKNDSSRQVGHSNEVSSPDFPGLATFSTWWLGLSCDADSTRWVDDTHGPRLSFPTVLIASRVTRHYLRHLAKKYMINHSSLAKNTDLYFKLACWVSE